MILSNRSFLSLLFLAKVFFQILIIKAGFLVVSGDDLMRTLISYQWSKAPFISSTSFGEVSATWMPLHFWLVGSLLKFYQDLWLIPALVSFFFSLCGLMALYLIGKCLFDEKTGIITVILAGFLPWEVWLTISGTAATIYQFTIFVGIFLVLLWEKSGRTAQNKLLLAAMAFMFSTMLRPEGWLFAGVFTFYLFTLFMVSSENLAIGKRLRESKIKAWLEFLPLPPIFARKGGFKKRVFIIAGCICWLFVGYWLYFNYISYDDPLYFLKRSQLSYQKEASGLDSFFVRLIYYPFILFVVSPSIMLLTTYAFTRFYRLWVKDETAKTYLFFTLGGLFLLILGSITGSGTRSTPQRYVILNLLLFIPLVAYALNHYMQKEAWRKAVVILLTIIVGSHLASSFHYPKEFNDQAQAAEFLKEQWKENNLGVQDLICLERTFHAYAGIPITGSLNLIYSLANRWAIQVLSNHPESFVYNLTEDVDLALNMDREKIINAFKDKKIRLIMVRSKEAVKKIPPDFQFVGSVGGYMLFSQGPENFTETLKPSPNKEMDLSAMKNFGNKIMLLGYNVDDNLFPRYVALYWKPLKPVDTNYRLAIKYIRPKDQEVAFTEMLSPFHGAYETSQWDANEIIEQRVYFPTSEFLSAGKYFINLSLVDLHMRYLPITNGEKEETEINIGPLPIIHTKRIALKEFLSGRLKDPGLLFKVLSSL